MLLGLFIFQNSWAESSVKNYVFAQRDTCTLTMDVYSPAKELKSKPCIVFVYGGGFKIGSKSASYNTSYLEAMADSGFVVASIDYRLGMKGIKSKGIKRINAIHNAINMAVEDLYEATNYLIKHANQFNIDPSKIIICGSSAGAITVLQADYELSNRTQISALIPPDFRYAGVISFAGGILSYHGAPTYKQAPAPTMFFHGTDDKLVRYNKIQIFKKGFFGTNALAKQFEKFDYSYYAYRYRDMGHEIAGYPMKVNINDICLFINEYVIQHRHLKKDILVKDPDLKRIKFGSWKPKDIYK